MGSMGPWLIYESELWDRYIDDYVSEMGITNFIMDREFIAYAQYRATIDLSKEVTALRSEVDKLKNSRG